MYSRFLVGAVVEQVNVRFLNRQPLNPFYKESMEGHFLFYTSAEYENYLFTILVILLIICLIQSFD